MKGCRFWAADKDPFDAFLAPLCWNNAFTFWDILYISFTILQSISSTQAKRFTKFRERKGLIDKDVV